MEAAAAAAAAMEKEEEEGDKDAYEPCTYVSVNDEDYRSFLAAEEKLKASPPNSLFSVPRPIARNLRGAHERTDATWIHYSF